MIVKEVGFVPRYFYNNLNGPPKQMIVEFYKKGQLVKKIDVLGDSFTETYGVVAGSYLGGGKTYSLQTIKDFSPIEADIAKIYLWLPKDTTQIAFISLAPKSWSGGAGSGGIYYEKTGIISASNQWIMEDITLPETTGLELEKLYGSIPPPPVSSEPVSVEKALNIVKSGVLPDEVSPATVLPDEVSPATTTPIPPQPERKANLILALIGIASLVFLVLRKRK